MSDDRESRPTPSLASGAERERSIALLRDAVGTPRSPPAGARPVDNARSIC